VTPALDLHRVFDELLVLISAPAEDASRLFSRVISLRRILHAAAADAREREQIATMVRAYKALLRSHPVSAQERATRCERVIATVRAVQRSMSRSAMQVVPAPTR